MQVHVTLAVVKVLASSILVHDIDTAAGARRINEHAFRADALLEEGLPDPLSKHIFAYRADKCCTQSQ
jgi:hypothetical protein